MGLFNKKNAVDVATIKEFLAKNGIEWNGGVITAFHKDKSVFTKIDNNTFNKIIKKPIRLIISSEALKDVDVITVGISKENFCLFNISNHAQTIDLSAQWQEFQKIKESQSLESIQRSF